MAINKARIARSLFFPEILPRLRELFGSGFFLLSYLLAGLLGAVRLLPAGHPYLNSENFGKFGLRHVLAEGANNLVFDKKHIDQICIYFLIVAGLIILFLQFAALLLAVVGLPVTAHAALTFGQLFGNPDPSQDLAFIIMDKVFGVPNLFESCISQIAVACEDERGNAIRTSTEGAFPYPIHYGLHALFGLFSKGVFVIGIIVLVYFAAAVIGETAVSGTPFGQRFNKAWAPIRIVLFFALITPINNGMNMAQYGTLYASKYGSNLATNSWNAFTTVLSKKQMAGDMIASPNVPQISELMRFVQMARTCKEAEILAYADEINTASHDVYIVKSGETGAAGRSLMRGMNFQSAHDFVDQGNITLHFGYIDENSEQPYAGGVNPSCGAIQMPTAGMSNPESSVIQAIYYDLLLEMYDDPASEIIAQCKITPERFPGTTARPCDIDYYEAVNLFAGSYNEQARSRIQDAIDSQQLNSTMVIPQALKDKGWGGAGIWYNQIAQRNGAVTQAVFGVPQGLQYPAVLQEVMRMRLSQDESVPEEEAINPDGAQNLGSMERPIAEVLSDVYMTWRPAIADIEDSGNPITRALSLVLGAEGLYTMYKNPDINPLAQLSSLGKAMIEATIRNLAIAGVGAGLNFVFDGVVGATGQAVSGFIMSIFSITTLMGFTLFYVIPFLPFMYFLLAVSAWVKSIFEAMVAMPLWSLAHISRMDGEGISGPAASNGYYLILEIFLRPIMTVVGLLAAVITFSALVQVLNETFQLAVQNTGGSGSHGLAPEEVSHTDIRYYRGFLDQFMYTIMYTVLVYIAALQSFKLVDVIPKQILRWTGQSVAAFQEDTGDPASQMISQTYSTSQLALGQLRSTLKGEGADNRNLAAALIQ